MCSTPVGISEVGSCSRSGRGPPCTGGDKRLAASLRLADWWEDVDGLGAWCSTPVGISEVGSVCSTSQQARLDGAQRLSASLRLAGGRERECDVPGVVLNACRHH